MERSSFLESKYVAWTMDQLIVKHGIHKTLSTQSLNFFFLMDKKLSTELEINATSS
jgi:hypothetical protein